MAEFTRDIKQLQNTASQQPSFAPPSQSLGQDVVNLAATGLDFYAKNKAQESLDLIATQQKQENRLITEGALKLRNYRLEGNGQMSKTAFLAGEQSILKDYSPEQRLAVLTNANKVMGKNTSQVVSDIDKRLSDEATDRKTLEAKVAELSPYIPSQIDLGADSQTLRALTLQGEARKASLDKDKSEAALRSTQLSNTGKERELDAEVYLIEYGAIVGNDYIKRANGLMDEVNFNDAGAVQDLRTQNQDFKKNFVQTAVADAASKGVILTPQQVEEQLSSRMSTFDSIDNLLSRKDIADMSANQIKATANNTILYLQNSKNEKEAALGNLINLSRVFPNSDYIGANIVELYTGTLLQGLGSADLTLTQKAQGVQSGFNSTDAKKVVMDVFKNADETVPMEAKDAYTETILEDLQGSNARRERLLNNGGLVTYVEAIAQGKPDFIISAEKQGEVLEGIMDNADEFLRRAVPQILNEKQLLGFKPTEVDARGRRKPSKGPKPIIATGEESLNALNPDTLRLSFPKPPPQLRKSVTNYNKFVDSLFVSLDKLGASKEEVDYFKNEIALSFNVASTKREDTN